MCSPVWSEAGVDDASADSRFSHVERKKDLWNDLLNPRAEGVPDEGGDEGRLADARITSKGDLDVAHPRPRRGDVR